MIEQEEEKIRGAILKLQHIVLKTSDPMTMAIAADAIHELKELLPTTIKKRATLANVMGDWSR